MNESRERTNLVITFLLNRNEKVICVPSDNSMRRYSLAYSFTFLFSPIGYKSSCLFMDLLTYQSVDCYAPCNLHLMANEYLYYSLL